MRTLTSCAGDISKPLHICHTSSVLNRTSVCKLYISQPHTHTRTPKHLCIQRSSLSRLPEILNREIYIYISRAISLPHTQTERRPRYNAISFAKVELVISSVKNDITMFLYNTKLKDGT